jgi:RNase P subunit RPR2
MRLMKFKVCKKCEEIVTKTGFISSRVASSNESGHFAKCHNKECGIYYSKGQYEKLEMKEM